jgi:hypothetical protein
MGVSGRQYVVPTSRKAINLALVAIDKRRRKARGERRRTILLLTVTPDTGESLHIGGRVPVCRAMRRSGRRTLEVRERKGEAKKVSSAILDLQEKG